MKGTMRLLYTVSGKDILIKNKVYSSATIHFLFLLSSHFIVSFYETHILKIVKSKGFFSKTST